MRKLFFIALLLVSFQSFGQMAKEDVTTILNEIWEVKAIETLYIVFDNSGQNSQILRASDAVIEKTVTENYVKFKDSNDIVVYLPFDKIKSISQSFVGELRIYMVN